MALAALSESAIRDMNWYYSVELKPLAFTKGRDFPNVLPTQRLLQRIDLSGMSVLDIGAQEGYFSVLAERAGAKVVSYDRVDRHDRINLVKEAYSADFAYASGLPFHTFATEHHRRDKPLFDVVIFSGVLYHVVEPMLFLYFVRTILKPGGIMLMETAATHNANYLLELSRSLPLSYYTPTTGWLDFALRALGFRVVDLEHIHSGKTQSIRRVATTCVLSPTADLQRQSAAVLAELAEYHPLRTSPHVDGAARIHADTYAARLFAFDSLDVTATVTAKDPMERKKVALTLDSHLHDDRPACAK
jgi:SAM-dependent methyltransferase